MGIVSSTHSKEVAQQAMLVHPKTSSCPLQTPRFLGAKDLRPVGVEWGQGPAPWPWPASGVG